MSIVPSKKNSVMIAPGNFLPSFYAYSGYDLKERREKEEGRTDQKTIDVVSKSHESTTSVFTYLDIYA